MRVIVAGSRTVELLDVVEEAMKAALPDWGGTLAVDNIVSGCCRGVDRLGEVWAGLHGIPVKRFRAEWDRFGKSAGFRRNVAMVQYAAAGPSGGALVAIWDGASSGTSHVISVAHAQRLRVHVHRVGGLP